jgi:hypothetical protein
MYHKGMFVSIVLFSDVFVVNLVNINWIFVVVSSFREVELLTILGIHLKDTFIKLG